MDNKSLTLNLTLNNTGNENKFKYVEGRMHSFNANGL